VEFLQLHRDLQLPATQAQSPEGHLFAAEPVDTGVQAGQHYFLGVRDAHQT